MGRRTLLLQSQWNSRLSADDNSGTFASGYPLETCTSPYGRHSGARGDGLHQRAIVRELMKHYQVWLDTPNFSMYHDLVAQGLRLVLRPTRLRAQAKTIERERHLFTHGTPPISAVRTMRYNKQGVEDHGSILAAMFATAGIPMPERPDFSLPIPDSWNAKARELLAGWNIGHKPLLVYRPQVLRSEWNQAQRNPDPAVYSTLFKSVRDRFFVVSIADLVPSVEWIEGPEQDADVKLHRGELDFPTMAALFELADMVMSPAGFGPILAQAVKVLHL